jgi:hypothetical protein
VKCKLATQKSLPCATQDRVAMHLGIVAENAQMSRVPPTYLPRERDHTTDAKVSHISYPNITTSETTAKGIIHST